MRNPLQHLPPWHGWRLCLVPQDICPIVGLAECSSDVCEVDNFILLRSWCRVAFLRSAVAKAMPPDLRFQLGLRTAVPSRERHHQVGDPAVVLTVGLMLGSLLVVVAEVMQVSAPVDWF
eukprot:GHVS01012071.1.p1 GENE.GHVS01012071.1~~GHVS01012071.1.p1  ORF type:complete len:119 (+),score=13.87 GHVS01012071.1:45-401(+)